MKPADENIELSLRRGVDMEFYLTCVLSVFVTGTDTAGSVRVPAAFCGILGFRPSHAAISVSGVIPMAQSFDTVGKLS